MVRISGRLVEPADDKPRSGVTLSLFSVKNSGTVLKHATYRCTTGGNGEYSFNAAPGSYDVAVSAYGSEPERVGRINVYEDSPPGSLNSFLLRPDEDDFTPEIIRIVQALADSAAASSSLSTKEANRSKAEADRAKSEADRAKQISGLGTVEDAIALAAVPFPDVWIPFNDSLRMFAGYGREVKVGDDVVARMVNFECSTTRTYIDKSGVLRTAAINEPRFEKQGLLIEGQSSNIVKFSSNRIWANGFSAGATLSLVDSTDPMTSSLCPKILRVGSEARYGVYLPPEISSPVTVGTVYTLTMRMRRLDAELGAISINSASGVKNSANSPAGVWTTRTITFTADATTVWPLPPQGEYEYAFIQLEALQFASSYIPTNGAAFTRAADKCWIQLQSNLPLPIKGVTISLTASIQNASDSRLFEINDGNTVVLSAQDSRMYPRFNKLEQTGVPVPVGINRVAFRIGTDGGITSYIGLAAYSGPTRASGSDVAIDKIAFGNNKDFSSNRGLFGHIRDLKIWHHPLSDTQIRGLK